MSTVEYKNTRDVLEELRQFSTFNQIDPSSPHPITAVLLRLSLQSTLGQTSLQSDSR